MGIEDMSLEIRDIDGRVTQIEVISRTCGCRRRSIAWALGFTLVPRPPIVLERPSPNICQHLFQNYLLSTYEGPGTHGTGVNKNINYLYPQAVYV